MEAQRSPRREAIERTVSAGTMRLIGSNVPIPSNANSGNFLGEFETLLAESQQRTPPARLPLGDIDTDANQAGRPATFVKKHRAFREHPAYAAIWVLQTKFSAPLIQLVDGTFPDRRHHPPAVFRINKLEPLVRRERGTAESSIVLRRKRGGLAPQIMFPYSDTRAHRKAQTAARSRPRASSACILLGDILYYRNEVLRQIVAISHQRSVQFSPKGSPILADIAFLHRMRGDRSFQKLTARA